jgi:hypothetical protein
MDNPARQLAVALRKIRFDAHRALKELHVSDPSYEQYSPDEHSDSASPESSIVAAIKTIQEADGTSEAKKYALDHRRYRLEWRGYSVARWTAVFLIIYTAVTAVIAIYSVRSSDSAKRSADIAHDAMIATSRPWVKYHVEPETDFRFIGDQGVINFKFILENVGHSVATSVTVTAKMFTSKGANIFNEPSQKQKILCDEIVSKPFAKSGLTLFPTDPIPVSVQVAENVANMKNDAIPFEGTSDSYVAPVVAGCVDYRYPPFPEHHQTGFIFEITRAEIVNGRLQNGYAIRVGETLPASKLSLIRYYFDGDYAN